MPSSNYTIVVFVTRKASLSPADFVEHWENVHVPLLKRLGGSRFPLSHRRHYLGAPGTSTTAQMLLGDRVGLDFDAFAVITFSDQSAFHDFVPVMSLPEVLEDEKRFTEPDKAKAIEIGTILSTNIDYAQKQELSFGDHIMFGTLYTRPFNPRSAAILAVAKDLKLELKLETITSSQNAPNEYRKLNPLAKIPTFVGEDGFVVSESMAIAIYIASQDANSTLLGTDKQQYASVLQWMSFANTEILSALGSWFNPLIGRQRFVQQDVERGRELTLFVMQVLDSHLQAKPEPGQGFLVGERLSLADLFVVSIVSGAFRFFLDADWRRAHPACTRWFTSIHGLPIYRNIAGDPALAESEMPMQPPPEK